MLNFCYFFQLEEKDTTLKNRDARINELESLTDDVGQRSSLQLL